MAKVILMMSVSLDGFVEGPDRDIDWHRVDTELHAHFNEQLAVMGRFLSGRVTWELMAGFWPTADEDPANAGPVADFARIWRDMPKIVYSRTMVRADWNTEIVREVVRAEVRALQESAGGDLALGGADLAVTFARLELIDEYLIYVHPVILGRGRPLFPPTDARTPLTLVESRRFGNGVVLLRYLRGAEGAIARDDLARTPEQSAAERVEDLGGSAD